MRILIVEDETLIAMHLEALVVAMGHEVCGFADRTADAVRLAREQTPDFMLLDVHLAYGDSGLAVAKVIASDCAAAIIVVSANVSEIVPESLGAVFRTPDSILDASLRLIC